MVGKTEAYYLLTNADTAQNYQRDEMCYQFTYYDPNTETAHYIMIITQGRSRMEQYLFSLGSLVIQ